MTTVTKHASEFLAAFDGAVDEFCSKNVKFDAEKLIAQFRLSKTDVAAVQEKLQKTTEELELLVIDADEQITEGYSNLTKAQQRDLLTMYHAVMEISTGRAAPKSEKAEGVKREPKAKVEAVTESHDAVYAICCKYNVIRAFVGNVKIAGSEVTADSVSQLQFGKKVNVMLAKDLTREEMREFVTQGKELSRVSTSLSGKTVDFVVKY
jgi:hypothetical protein